MPPRRPPSSDPRERLITAAATVVARYGYRDASVARIVAQARVSRATFYENFADRDECVLAAYRHVAAGIERGLALAEEGSPELDSPRRAVAALLAWAERNPASARLSLIEARGAAAEVRAEHEHLLDRIETAIDARLAAPVQDDELFEIPSRALLGGVAGVVSIRAFRNEAGRLTALLDDLVAWLGSYAIVGRARRGKEEWAALGSGLSGGLPESLGDAVLDRRLPRGRASLPEAIVAGEQRERVLAAIARLSREKGYQAMTVADVVAVAGITREAFYGLFRSKGDAYLATQAFGLEKSIALTAGSFFGEQEWPDRVWNGLETTLGYVAGQRDLTFVDLVESYAAGPAAIRRSFETRMAYTLFLEEGYRQRPEAEALPRLCSEAISAAIHELMRCQVISNGTERMLEILPQVAYLTMAPFLGPAEAIERVEAKLATASG